MTVSNWAYVWVVRKDGWMRRLPLALPLQREMRINELAEETISARLRDEDPLAPDAGLQLKHRIFVLQRVRANQEQGLPWAEPHFYLEI